MDRIAVISLLALFSGCPEASLSADQPPKQTEVSGSCGSYERQCEECLDTLRASADRSGVPVVDRASCPACSQYDSLCQWGSVQIRTDQIKTWTGPIPPPRTPTAAGRVVDEEGADQ